MIRGTTSIWLLGAPSLRGGHNSSTAWESESPVPQPSMVAPETVTEHLIATTTNRWLKGISSLGLWLPTNWGIETLKHNDTLRPCLEQLRDSLMEQFFFCFDSTSSLTSGAQAVLVKKRLAKPLFMVDKKGWNILNILLFSLFLFFILFFFFLRLFPVVVPSPFGPPPPTTLLLLCPSRAGVSFFFGMLSSYR